MSYDNNDPRLTAYVLDEADADECAAIDEARKTDPVLGSLIDEFASASRAVDKALLANDGLALTAEQREQIQVKAATKRPRAGTRGRMVVGAIAALAASVLIAWVFTEDRPFAGEPKRTRMAGSVSQPSRESSGESTSAKTNGKTDFTIAPAPAPAAAVNDLQSTVKEQTLNDLGLVENRTKTVTESLLPMAQDAPEQDGLDEFGVTQPRTSAGEESGQPIVQSQPGNLQNVQVGGSIRVRANYFSPKDVYGATTESDTVAQSNLGGLARSGVNSGAVNGNGIVSNFSWQEDKLAGQKEHDPSAIAGTKLRDLKRDELHAIGYFGEAGEARIDEKQPMNVGYSWQWADGTAESYAPIVENAFIQVMQQPLSTFGLDVDTASYANVRRFLNNGKLPPPNAVRVEEFVNAFSYEYVAPTDGRPVAVHGEIAGCPWNAEHRLARISVKAKEIPFEAQPPLRLTFLIDVSGSMEDNKKLPLLRESMKALTRKLRPTDQVAIVTYRDSAQRVLAPTPGASAESIIAAIDALHADGSTNGAGGIELAYTAADEQFLGGGLNRVILATDGDFNVGETENVALVQRIAEHAKSGVFLTVLGFGIDNLKDDRLEGLADKGNGNYYYIDSYAEANKVLVERMAGTIAVVAKDVKIQVEFNPAKIGAYRLLGYENRALTAQDFNDDKKDAGDLGAGHTVTALYELVPVGASIGAPGVDELKYQYQATPAPTTNDNPETMTVKLRYKQPNANESDRIELPLTDKGLRFENAPDDFRFASAAAAFAMLLRNSQFAGGATYDMVRQVAEASVAGGAPERAEFISLVVAAKTLVDASNRR